MDGKKSAASKNDSIKQEAKSKRELRLATSLRSNLHKRKMQARRRAEKS